ncbi:MAG: DUF29 domain-containing protein [Candidatus Competibacteraceae bacterium]|nr:MAG: DUF29 domain-containing protein [Candidatus Competibacteraceae bacterium]
MSPSPANETSYDADFFLWTQQQAARLRQGRWSQIDAANLAEEIESMGKSDRRAIISHLAIILRHLLEWCRQPERRGTRWRLSIRNGRQEIDWIVNDSPSLRRQLSELIESVYPMARENAADETGLALDVFPEQCPFTVEQVIGDDWPESVLDDAPQSGR